MHHHKSRHRPPVPGSARRGAATRAHGMTAGAAQASRPGLNSEINGASPPANELVPVTPSPAVAHVVLPSSLRPPAQWHSAATQASCGQHGRWLRFQAHPMCGMTRPTRQLLAPQPHARAACRAWHDASERHRQKPARTQRRLVAGSKPSRGRPLLGTASGYFVGTITQVQVHR